MNFLGQFHQNQVNQILENFSSNSMILNSGESTSTIISGFTFGGFGAVKIDGSSATIRNSVFQNSVLKPQSEENSRSTDFSGVLLDIKSGNPVFENVSFTDQVMDLSNVDGSGTWITLSTDSVTFIDSHFDRLVTKVQGYEDLSRKGNVFHQTGGSAFSRIVRLTKIS